MSLSWFGGITVLQYLDRQTSCSTASDRVLSSLLRLFFTRDPDRLHYSRGVAYGIIKNDLMCRNRDHIISTLGILKLGTESSISLSIHSYTSSIFCARVLHFDRVFDQPYSITAKYNTLFTLYTIFLSLTHCRHLNYCRL